MKEITAEEKEQFITFWMTQRQAIVGQISDKTMRWFDIYTVRDNVGYEFGQLRPGKLGQWDLYWNLTGSQSVGCDENETLIASGLTAAEIAEVKRQEHYRDNGVDPDNMLEVAMFERMQTLSPEQLEATIALVEKRLDTIDQVVTRVEKRTVKIEQMIT